MATASLFNNDKRGRWDGEKREEERESGNITDGDGFDIISIL